MLTFLLTGLFEVKSQATRKVWIQLSAMPRSLEDVNSQVAKCDVRGEVCWESLGSASLPGDDKFHVWFGMNE